MLDPLLPSLASDQAEMRAHQAMLENLQGRFPGGIWMQQTEIRVVEGPSLIAAITEEVLEGGYDLVALGAENQVVQLLQSTSEPGTFLAPQFLD